MFTLLWGSISISFTFLFYMWHVHFVYICFTWLLVNSRAKKSTWCGKGELSLLPGLPWRGGKAGRREGLVHTVLVCAASNLVCDRTIQSLSRQYCIKRSLYTQWCGTEHAISVLLRLTCWSPFSRHAKYLDTRPEINVTHAYRSAGTICVGAAWLVD